MRDSDSDPFFRACLPQQMSKVSQKLRSESGTNSLLSRSDKESHSNFPSNGPDLFSKSMFLSSSPEVSPTDQKNAGFNNHRKALAVLGTDSSSQPPARLPPASVQTKNQIAPWGEPPSRPSMPSQSFGHSFYNESSENVGQLSPSFRPGTSRVGASELAYNEDTRRPSVASNNTVSSQGSKASAAGRIHKNLKGFFGNEYDVQDSRVSSDPTVNTQSSQPMSRESSKQRNRTESINTTHTTDSNLRPPSPSGRPHTPLPSSDVTPWMYQNFNVSCSTYLQTCEFFDQAQWRTRNGLLARFKGRSLLRILKTSTTCREAKRVMEENASLQYGFESAGDDADFFCGLC